MADDGDDNKTEDKPAESGGGLGLLKTIAGLAGGIVLGGLALDAIRARQRWRERMREDFEV